jgi:Phage antirepressor protein KilAC domain
MSAVMSGATGRELAIRDVEGEPRILDTDLAERLGFAKPVKIRDLIKRHKKALEAMGTLPTVGRVINGGAATEFYLNRQQSLFITMKSETATATEITVEVVRKFDEYERGGRPAALPSLEDARAMRAHLLGYAEQVIALEEKVEELTPKATAWERLAGTDGVIIISNVAKACGVRPLWLGDFLVEIRWCFRRRPDAYWPEGRKPPLVVYEEPTIKRRWMTHKIVTLSRDDGSEWSRSQAVFTPAGAAEVAERIERWKAKTGGTR